VAPSLARFWVVTKIGMERVFAARRSFVVVVTLSCVNQSCPTARGGYIFHVPVHFGEFIDGLFELLLHIADTSSKYN
jgi:hypothetical protein